MALTDPGYVQSGRPYLEWGPIIGGAVGAASLSFLLLTFGGAVGLSLTSPWPDTGARLWVVGLAIAWWMVLVQIGSFAAGGYLAGRMRSRWSDSTLESGFRDSTHGFMVWAVGVLFGAIVFAVVGLSTAKTATQSASVVAAGATTGATSNPRLISATPSDYAVDLLLRPQPSQPGSAGADTKNANGDVEAARSEANRIFAGAIRNQAITERDRSYLGQFVVARTGMPEAEAQKRVDAAITEARDLELKARQQVDKARKATVVTAFIAAVSLLISLAAAIVAAGAGARHRDENRMPTFAGHRFW